MSSLLRSTQIQRLMQTTIALPPIASSRRSKYWTKSSAIKRIRFSLPTSATSAAHLVLSFYLRSSSSPSVISPNSKSTLGNSASFGLSLAMRLS